MAYTTIDNSGEYFKSTVYTGTGSSRSIDTGFAPDWVWIKKRSAAANNCLYDTIRGATKTLHSDVTNGESIDAPLLTAFETDGFTVGTGANVNESSATFVSWNWKAGTAFSNDASSTGVGSIDSAGSVSTEAGFSIVSYTGTENLQTVKHGLSTVPSMIIFKNRSASANWKVYHKSLGATKGLKLDSSDALFTSAGNFNNTEPTSSVFTVNTDVGLNGSGNSIISYCFAEVKGYSKFGSYTGNGNADGTFVYTGFKPAWVMIKGSSVAESWLMFDTKRNTYNGIDGQVLRADLNNAEVSSSAVKLEFLSNGFKWRSTDAGHNGSGSSYIYLAFAESPFVNSKGIPNNAR